MRKLLHSITISFILIGLLLGYAKADYNYDPFSLWDRYYYIWDKGVGILLGLCVIFPAKSFKIAWGLVVSFFCIREVWEVFAIVDYSKSNRPSVIFLLFCAVILVICFIMFSPELKKVNRIWIQPLVNRLKKAKWRKQN